MFQWKFAQIFELFLSQWYLWNWCAIRNKIHNWVPLLATFVYIVFLNWRLLVADVLFMLSSWNVRHVFRWIRPKEGQKKSPTQNVVVISGIFGRHLRRASMKSRSEGILCFCAGKKGNKKGEQKQKRRTKKKNKEGSEEYRKRKKENKTATKFVEHQKIKKTAIMKLRCGKQTRSTQWYNNIPWCDNVVML